MASDIIPAERIQEYEIVFSALLQAGKASRKGGQSSDCKDAMQAL